MLIGLCGGICAGKHAIAEYLIQQGFQLLELASKPQSHITESGDDLRLQASEIRKKEDPKSSELTFQDADSLLDFATKRWQERWVTTDISDATTLDRFLLRPFFLLVSVDAPVSLRWKRFADRCWRRQLDPPELEKFVMWNDHNLYDKDIGRVYLTDKAQLRLFNSSSSLEELHSALQTLDLADEQRLRPNWDQYFMQLASLAAQRSNCMKRRVHGAIAEMEEESVCQPVFAFMPKKMHYWKQAARGFERGRSSIVIPQVGISEVVYSQGYNMDNDSAAILQEAGVRLRQFHPPTNGLIYLQAPERPTSEDQ
ncbi:Cytidine deaminase [Penicillium expansum]|uniref:Cytidine deaminase n=1 Tax=Penicillium expansum TaxID=27334 RepID=A0A0A2J1V8_PENEN|nr:Cytidine deaminase [Penicillium expansum]KGO43836.1 Cytidine deaminase [Penicillium expansum]KGO49309.1 Cytidine deaminase [Penicillium expansum]KGO52198.1 Cytidine deaminase [Penicillium expansum]